MIFSFDNLIEIKGGLSKKKVYRKYEKKISKIVLDFSNESNEYKNFLQVYDILKKLNISIPKIYEVYPKKKIIVMEDFGKKSFDKILEEEDLYNLLKLAVENLIIIQNSIMCDDLLKLKKYTHEDLKSEISEFVDFYIPYKKISNFASADFYKTWVKAYKNQKFDFSSFSHKDYEFINLILLSNKSLHLKCGIIDFQSAFVGFVGWDLFSILENPRLNLTRDYNEDLIKYFYENVNVKSKFDSFRNQYYLLNLSRLTRLLGRWIKLLNEGNKEFIKFVEPTQKRIIFCLQNIQDRKLKKIYEEIFIN